MLKYPRALEVNMRNLEKVSFSIVVFIEFILRSDDLTYKETDKLASFIIWAINLPTILYNRRHKLIWIPATAMSVISLVLHNDPTEVVKWAIAVEVFVFTLTAFKDEVKND